MCKASTVFMWIFTIILGLSLLTIIVTNIWMAYGKLDVNGSRRGLAKTIKFLGESESQHTVVETKVVMWSSIVAAVSFVLCIITGVASSNVKDGFRIAYMN